MREPKHPSCGDSASGLFHSATLAKATSGDITSGLHVHPTRQLNGMAVYLALRRRGESVAYANEPHTWKCDFVTAHEAIQVCKELTEENRDREITGALRGSALPGKGKRTPVVVTMDQRDRVKVGDVVVEIRPVWEWMK